MWAMSTTLPLEQYPLFSLPSQLARLQQETERLMESSRAPNTLKAYNFSWKGFADWCDEYGRQASPAKSATVCEFVTWAAKLREPVYSLETIRLGVSAIKYQHVSQGFADPIDDDVRKVVAGIAREAARQGDRKEGAGKKELSVTALRRVCRALRDDDPMDVRDRAIVLLGFASALRRSEIAAIGVQHVNFDEHGLHLWLPFSKTDQEGKGRKMGIPYGQTDYTCPVRAVKAWLKVRGERKRGPLFVGFLGCRQMRPEARGGLGEQAICNVLKRALDRVGEDASLYGAHSMRSG